MASDHEEGGGKRQRVSRACDLCRRKKIKCDGSIPICGNCKAFALECTYKDTTKKRGPPKGYIEAIENRLYKLENLLSEMAQSDDPKAKSLLDELNTPLETPSGEQIFDKPQRRSAHGSDRSKVFFWQNAPVRPKSSPSGDMIPNNNSVSSSLDNCILDANSVTTIQKNENMNGKPKRSSIAGLLNGGEPSDSTGQLAMDANGQYRYLGKSSGFYLLQKSRTYHHGAFHLSAYQRNSSRSISSSPSFLSPVPPCPPNVDPYELPSSELSTTLIRLYFRYFYPVLPIFYKQQLSSSMDDPAEPISPLLLNAIYAVASRVCDDIEIRSDPTRPETAGDIFFERAKYLLDSHYDIPRVSTVQALLLLASHQQGTMKSARAWLYSGMAFRMALDLGLNRNCDHWQIPSDEKERRKRVFWCCFVVDRLASATFGRSSTFEESDCDTPFPINDDDEPVFTPNPTQHTIYMKPPGPLVALSHLVKICDILGHVLKNIYYAKALQHSDMRHISQIVSVLAGRLAHWYKNLPPSLRMDNYTQQQQDVTYPVCVPQLHMVYHTAVILLHRLFISNNPADASPESISEYNTCAISATAIMNIANSMLKNNTLKYVFHSVVYFIFTSGIIFINSASSNDATKSFDAKVNINNIMRLLDELEKTWPSAARCSTILGELAGLRELNLPTSENTLRPIVQKSNHSSPMSSPSAAEINLGPSTAASTITTTSSSSEMANIDKTKRRIPGIDRKQWNQHSIMMGSLSDEIRSGTSFSDSSPDLGYRISSPRDLQQQQQQQSTYTKGNMDPFAAPDTIPVPSQRQQFDLSGAAFWGVPPSLDLDEWSHYLGTQMPTYQQPNVSNPSSPLSHSTSIASSQPLQHIQQQQQQIQRQQQLRQEQEQQRQPVASSGSNLQPHLIPSRNIIAQFDPSLKPSNGTFNSMLHSAQSTGLTSSSSISSPSIDAPSTMTSSSRSNISSPGTRYTRKHLIHGDSNVDVLSGMPIPLDLQDASENGSSMFGFLSDQTVGTTSPATTTTTGLSTTGNELIGNPQQEDTVYQFGNDALIYY